MPSPDADPAAAQAVSAVTPAAPEQPDSDSAAEIVLHGSSSALAAAGSPSGEDELDTYAGYRAIMEMERRRGLRE